MLEQHPGGDELQHLADAVSTSAHLSEVADHLIGHFVDRARRSGASWTDIGEHMGVSKQAAQKRFVPRESDDLDDDEFRSRPGLGRLTKRASTVLRRAKDAAQRRGDAHVAAAHVLLGLLDEPQGLAAQAITAQGVSLEQVRGATLASLGAPAATPGDRPRYSREAKKILELSLREALRMGHSWVGTEHLLLAMLRDDTEPVTSILAALGITCAPTESWLTDTLEGLGQRVVPEAPRSAPSMLRARRRR